MSDEFYRDLELSLPLAGSKGRSRWVAKFVLRGEQQWVPDGPWETKGQALETERRHRDCLEARQSAETSASFADRWLEEWPRAATSTQRNYAKAAARFAEHFGPTPLGDVQRLSARTWALSVPRYISRSIRTMYEDARNVGLVESNPFDNLRLPATERKRQITAPTMEQLPGLPGVLHLPRWLWPRVPRADPVRGMDGPPSGRASSAALVRRRRGAPDREPVTQARRH